jgi:hypothetical protein
MQTVPLEPQMAMFKGLLLLCNSLRQAFPAWSLITDSSFKIMAYKRGNQNIYYMGIYLAILWKCDG